MNRTILTVTIAENASVSGATVDIDGYVPVALVLPATWTAADITVQASVDGTNYADVYQDDDTEYTIKAAASRHVVLEAADFLGVRKLKLRSGTAGTPVNQAAARVITLLLAAVQ